MDNNDRPTSSTPKHKKPGVKPRTDLSSERFRWSFEDPMYSYLLQQKEKDKTERIEQLKAMLDDSSSSSESQTESPKRKKKRHKEKKEHKRKRHKSKDKSNVISYSQHHKEDKSSKRTDKKKKHNKEQRKKEKHVSKSEEFKHKKRKLESDCFIETSEELKDATIDQRSRDNFKHRKKRYRDDDEFVDEDCDLSACVRKSGHHTHTIHDHTNHRIISDDDRLTHDRHSDMDYDRHRDKRKNKSKHKKHKHSSR